MQPLSRRTALRSGTAAAIGIAVDTIPAIRDLEQLAKSGAA